MRSWVEVGGFPAWPKEETKGLLSEASSSPCPPFSLPLSTFQLVLNFPLQSLHSVLTFPFLGVRLITKGQSTVGGGTKVGGGSATAGDRGVGKDEGSHGRVRGRRSLWLLRGVILHPHPHPSQPPLKKPHFAPSATISQPPPQESTGPEVSDPPGQATGPASPTAPSAPEEAILAHMQSLQIQVRGIKLVYKCWVEDCKKGPSTSQATICAHLRKVHLGVRLVCSLCGKTFFNLDVLRCHKKVMLINIP